MRKTKIIATLGPATESPETLGKLIDAGLNLARLNMSHGTHPWVRKVVSDLRAVAEKRGVPVGILMDTQGPAIRTGDIGHFDGKYLVVTSRLKEILKIGGINTSPVEIEEFLSTIPGVKASVVVGVPDERLGQVPYAFIQLDAGAKLTEGEVRQSCSKHIAHYKVPAFVEFVAELPRTETGKIRRAALAKQALDAVGAKARGS